MTSRTYVALAAVFVVALGLRVAWLGATDTVLLPMSDPQYYHATAVNIAEGRGFSVAVDERGFVSGPESEATAFWAPGYPAVIAPLYALFGADEGWAKALNALAGALTVLPVFYLGRRLFDNREQRAKNSGSNENREQRAAPRTENREQRTERESGTRGDHEHPGAPVGLLAAALVAIAPANVYWTAALFSEPLFTLGITSTIAYGVWARERGTMGAYFVTGVLLIATAFVRSQGLLMIVPVAVLLIRGFDLRSLVRTFVPVAAAVALFVVPWAARNEIRMGEPTLINNNLGYNLRLAHAPYSKGTSVPPQDLWDEQPGISFKEREALFNDLGTERAIEYAFDHPQREAELAVRRVGYLLRSDARPAIRWSESLGRTEISVGDRDAWIWLGHVYWYPLLALTIVSPLFVARTRVAWALWSACGVWVLLHTVFAGEPRYHAPLVPLVPAMAVLAAGVLVRGCFRHRGTEAQRLEARG